MSAPRHGFSLIELLVAVAVFAVAAAMAWAGLDAVARTRLRLADAQQQFAAVQRSVDFLARDLVTTANRPVRAGRGGRLPALLGDAHRLELSRKGVASELRSTDSALERVVWFSDNASLVRGRYAVLDRNDGSVPVRRDMDSAIQGLELRYLDHAGGWHDHWPLSGEAGADHAALPRAVEFRIAFEQMGELRRIVELPVSEAVISDSPGSAP